MHVVWRGARLASLRNPSPSHARIMDQVAIYTLVSFTKPHARIMDQDQVAMCSFVHV